MKSEDRNPTRFPNPDAVNHRRPQSLERQGPQQRRPEYDYFPDIDYLDYFDSRLNDYFDCFDYFLLESEVSPNPMCDPNPSPIYLYAYLLKSCIIK